MSSSSAMSSSSLIDQSKSFELLSNFSSSDQMSLLNLFSQSAFRSEPKKTFHRISAEHYQAGVGFVCELEFSTHLLTADKRRYRSSLQQNKKNAQQDAAKVALRAFIEQGLLLYEKLYDLKENFLHTNGGGGNNSVNTNGVNVLVGTPAPNVTQSAAAATASHTPSDQHINEAHSTATTSTSVYPSTPSTISSCATSPAPVTPITGALSMPRRPSPPPPSIDYDELPISPHRLLVALGKYSLNCSREELIRLLEIIQLHVNEDPNKTDIAEELFYLLSEHSKR